jgi:predicted outer membrane repeat protein
VGAAVGATDVPYGCYYKRSTELLYFNPSGNMEDDDPDRVSICKLAATAAPTATPTNVGDTHTPTVSPTAAPTFSHPTNWADLKATCSESACDTANGGCSITLSEDFAMGSYSGEIEFSGKAITIWGQGKVLDASGLGRLFKGEHLTPMKHGLGHRLSNTNGESFLELHDAVLQNSKGAPTSCRSNPMQACASNAECTGEDYYYYYYGSTSPKPDECVRVDGSLPYTFMNAGQFNYRGEWGQGGAIFIDGGTLVIHFSTFDTNDAIWGGAIYALHASVEIYYSTFKSNTAKAAGEKVKSVSSFHHGGAIFAAYANAEIHDSTFKSNAAGEDGGAIYAGEVAQDNIYCTMQWCAKSVGRRGYGVFEIHDTIFQSNTAGRKGGGICLVAGDPRHHAEIHDTIFQSNTAAAPSGHNGGAIDVDGADVEIYNSTFESSDASSDANIVEIYNSGTAEIHDSTFESKVSASFPLHYFSVQPEHISQKGLSQIFASISREQLLKPPLPKSS